MKKKINDADMPIGKLTRVKDMLPSPEELTASGRTVKVTLRLSVGSIKFFKQFAQKYNTKYQKLIRNLIDAYTEKFSLPH